MLLMGLLISSQTLAAPNQAQIDQVKQYIDRAVDQNRGMVETAVREGPSGNWGEAARTLLRAVRPSSGNILGFQLPTLTDQGAKDRDLLILQNFPMAIRYAASKVGKSVFFPDPSPAAVSQAHQYVDIAFQNNRGPLENAVRAAQNGMWEDAAYDLCTAAPQEAECLIVFPEMMSYAASKFGRTVAVGDTGITASSSGQVNLPVTSESTSVPSSGRLCIREEVTRQIYCGELLR
jgi:hypothetical protein